MKPQITGPDLVEALQEAPRLAQRLADLLNEGDLKEVADVLDHHLAFVARCKAAAREMDRAIAESRMSPLEVARAAGVPL